MARLVFLISLAFAVVALYGWPPGANVWMRALIALAAMMIGICALVLAAPASKSRRFESVHQLRASHRLLGGLLFATALVAFYFILVFSPPAASRFSEYVVTYVRASFGGNGKAPNDSEQNETASEQDSSNSEYDVGALFDPNGAVIPKSANLAPSKKPAVSIKMQGRADAEKLIQSGQIYLHLFSHHAFDGERWTAPSPTIPDRLTPGPDGLIRLQPDDQAAQYRYTVLHHELSSGLDALTTLQGARYVKLPQVMELHSGTWLLPPPDNPLGIIRPYEAGSTPKRFRDLLASATAIEPGNPGAAYLAPSGNAALNLEIRNLAASFRNRASKLEQLAELQGWLSKSFAYSLQVDYPDKDKSALQSFLDKPGASEGFCVHFASAAALISRELGVPSRISYGWTGGEYYRKHHQFVFEAEDGHAWAEIYLKDHGWVVFETTPPSALPTINPTPAATTPPPAGQPKEEDEKKTAPSKKSPSWTWMVVGLCVAVALLMLQLLKRNRSEQGGADPHNDLPAPPPDYLQFFHEAGARLGHPKPIGHTLRQYLEQLERDGAAIPFAAELVTYHYQVTYREVPRDSRLEKHFCRLIRAL